MPDIRHGALISGVGAIPLRQITHLFISGVGSDDRALKVFFSDRETQIAYGTLEHCIAERDELLVAIQHATGQGTWQVQV